MTLDVRGSSAALAPLHAVRPQAANGGTAADVFELEDPDYLCRQLITYIGNKRALLAPIGQAVETVKRRLNKTKLRAFDVFSGSGVVSRYLKAYASHLVSNDMEDYAAATSRCYLRNRSTVDFAALGGAVADLNARSRAEGLPEGLHPRALLAPGRRRHFARRPGVLYHRQRAAVGRLPPHDRRGARRDARAAAGAAAAQGVRPRQQRRRVQGLLQEQAHGRRPVRRHVVGCADADSWIDPSRTSGSEPFRVRPLRVQGRCQPSGAGRQGHGHRLHRPALQPAPIRLELLHAESAGPLREASPSQPACLEYPSIGSDRDTTSAPSRCRCFVNYSTRWMPDSSWSPSTTTASSAPTTCRQRSADSARCRRSRPATTPIAPAGT